VYPTIKIPTCQTLSQNLHTPISHPAQRRWLPQETQPFLPAIQRSDDGSSLTFRPQETQPFLPAIQRSADGSSNSREYTQSSSPHQSPLPPVAPHTHHYLPPGIEQPGRRVPVGYDSAGGELILGWRKSALFLAEFRQPRSSPRRSPEPTGTRLPGVRHPPSALHPPPQKRAPRSPSSPQRTLS